MKTRTMARANLGTWIFKNAEHCASLGYNEVACERFV